MSDSTTNINDNRNECENELRRGPWTLEEDNLLIEYISCRGEGRWNSLAKFAGLKRTGKSCRLRWLNYLKPDIKRGNLTPHEQLLILELHSKWGNRWSRIAQHLPGRTDNEIKNYWRTKVQKQARQLKLDSNSKNFLEAIRRFWMKKLVEEMEQNTPSTSAPSTSSTNIQTTLDPAVNNDNSGSDLNLTQSEFPIEDEYYNVGFPTCINYDMQEMDNTISQHHVAGTDWFEEDLGSTFWNTDELWQFNKNWD